MTVLNKEKSLFTILIIIVVFFLLNFYSGAIFNPNQILFNDSGDAVKNYFTYAGHIQETKIINSHLMNYPYGENFFYLDCQPLFSLIIKSIGSVFPGIFNYSIGILHFFLIFSILLTSIFIYLIFKELRISSLYAVFAAFSITVLSPQIFRINGHFGLSYSFFIPLTWYLYLKFSNSTRKIKWSILLLINNICWFFVHAYLGMIITSFLFLCFIFQTLFFYQKKEIARQSLFVLIQSILPIILFWLTITLSDTHVGRTNNQFGFLTYIANFDSVFFPNHPPLRDYFGWLKLQQDWEGWSYIGMGTNLTILIFILSLIIKGIFKKDLEKERKVFKNSFLITAILSSIVLLLLSMGYPFKWGMEYLLDSIPVLKSFRGIGRFSWVFYFVMTITSAYYFYLICTRLKLKSVFLVISFILPLLYLYEGIPYHKEMSKKIAKTENLYNKSLLSDSFIKGLEIADNNKYQAIIPLPYYHIGSENYGKHATNKIYNLSMLFAYHSGLPLMSNYSTRTSIPESKNLVQLFSPDFYNKSIKSDIHSDKPFLIIFSKEELTDSEQSLIKKSDEIYSTDDFSLYSISFEKMFENTSAKEIENFKNIESQLTDNDGFLTSKTNTKSEVYYNSFDDKPINITFRGNGAFSGEIKNYNQLIKVKTSELQKDSVYIASFWMYNKGENYGQDALNCVSFIEAGDDNGKVDWIEQYNPSRSMIINGDWSLVEISFKAPEWAKSISVYIKGDDNSTRSFIVDDILIRAKDTDVYKVIKEKNHQILELFKNNHQIMAI